VSGLYISKKFIFFSYFSSFYSNNRRLTDYTINQLIVDYRLIALCNSDVMYSSSLRQESSARGVKKYKKSVAPNVRPKLGCSPRRPGGPIFTKFCTRLTRINVPDMFLSFDFHKNHTKNVGAVVGRNFPSPIEKAHRLYNKAVINQINIQLNKNYTTCLSSEHMRLNKLTTLVMSNDH